MCVGGGGERRGGEGAVAEIVEEGSRLTSVTTFGVVLRFGTPVSLP